MTKISTLIKRTAFFLTFSIVAQAQTNPTAQTLPYSQDFSALLSTSTVYPVGWQGWNLSTAGSSTAFRTIAPVGDNALIASGTAASTTGGVYNYNGKIGMLASSSIDPAICLALVTTGVNRVTINFDIMTIRNPSDASNTRINGVDLQYRVGTSGAFLSATNIANGTYQNNSVNQTGNVTTPQNSVARSITLPTACNNQPLVQVRWVQRDISGAGSRASFAVDNIVICSTITSTSISITGPSTACTGQSAVYGSSVTNGGTTPSYQWKKNGVNTGTNTASIELSGLVATNQVSCVLTSSINCSSTATSNTITIASSGAPPSISTANVLQACPGQSNGSIDLTVTGGTSPYTVCWDTTNTTNGPMFGVTLGTKICPGNPYCGMGVLGNAASFRVDGADAKNLSLVRGITYTFNVNASHPWHLSTDSVGANSIGLLTTGTTGSMPSGLTTVTLKANNTHPSTLYYPCASHDLMGYKIFLQSGFCTEDLTNLHTGTYAVIVKDANGCTAANSYVINQTGGPVTATLGSSTNASCFGSANGNINLNPSGGSAPYTASGTGPTFMVISQLKNHSHPQFGTGSANGYTIDNVQGKELTLMRGITYSFSVLAPGHPFFISTSLVGGPGNLGSEVLNGVTGSMTTSGTLTFTPNSTHPTLLYYQCANHNNMGWKINIVDQLPNADLGNCMAGSYSLLVKNANGCSSSSPVNVTITQPAGNTFYYDGDGDNYGLTSESALACTAPAGFVINNGDCNDANPSVHPGAPELCNGIDDNCDNVSEDSISINLNNLTNSTCGGNNASIDINVSGGTGPYTICWDTVNTVNGATFGVMIGAVTEANPYFNFGPPAAYYIDGVEAKELTLTKGITYDFNVFSPGHPWHITTDLPGGSTAGLVVNGQTGAPSDNGIVSFTPDNTHPSLLGYACAFHQYMGYNININNGYCVEDPVDLGPGVYTVTVSDATGCGATASYSVGQTGDPANAVLVSSTDATCYGYADGTIDLNPSGGIAPYTALGNGPTFMVISQTKNHSHPQFGAGSGNGYTIDGVQGKELTLIRGITYYFSVLAPGHPFFISTSDIGGPNNLGSEVTDGVTNSFTTNGTLTFTPNNNHPNLLYYQCAAHNRMGWRINIVDQLTDVDLGNCMSGNYSLYVKNADGCTSAIPVNVFIAEPAANTFYYDADNDAYGISSESALACTAPAGFAAIDGDCAPVDPDVNPGYAEVCNNGIDDNCDTQIDEGCNVMLHVKVLLQGYYTGNAAMQPTLLNEGESIDPTLSDSIIIELHEDVSPFDFLDSRQVIVSVNGDATVQFPPGFNGTDVYLVIRQRNSIETWSKLPVTLGPITTFDFTVPE